MHNTGFSSLGAATEHVALSAKPQGCPRSSFLLPHLRLCMALGGVAAPMLQAGSRSPLRPSAHRPRRTARPHGPRRASQPRSPVRNPSEPSRASRAASSCRWLASVTCTEWLRLLAGGPGARKAAPATRRHRVPGRRVARARAGGSRCVAHPAGSLSRCWRRGAARRGGRARP